jgi:hypothetical protein
MTEKLIRAQDVHDLVEGKTIFKRKSEAQQNLLNAIDRLPNFNPGRSNLVDRVYDVRGEDSSPCRLCPLNSTCHSGYKCDRYQKWMQS